MDQIFDQSIIVTQSIKTDSINIACLQANRSNKGDMLASVKILQALQRALRQMIYIGRDTYPTFLYHASAIATKTSDLHVRHLKELYLTIFYATTTPPILS